MRATPAVGEVWRTARESVRLTWVSSDGTVAEGFDGPHKVVRARCLLLERVDPAPAAPAPAARPRARAHHHHPSAGLDAALLAAREQLDLFDAKERAKPKRRAKPKLPRILKQNVQHDPPEGAARTSTDSIEEGRLVPSVKLRPYQLEGAAWLSAHTGAILADPPGLGKSPQIIAAIPEGAPTMVICPSAARDGVWPKHVAWRPDLRHSVVSRRKGFHWPEPGEVVCITYDSLPAFLDKPGPMASPVPKGLIVVLDEAHLAKNPQATRAKRVARICRDARATGGKTWLATGHPLKNKAPDLWALLVLAGLGDATWRTGARFERAFGRCPYSGEYINQPEENVPEILSRVLLRRSFRDVVPEMPPQQWDRHQVVISEADAQVADAVLLALEAAGINLEEATAETLQNQKTNSAAGELMRARKLLATAKIPALLELADAHEGGTDSPLVVFSAHLAPLQALEGRNGWERVSGSTSSAQRAALSDAFQSGELRGLAITIGPVATAMSLSAARHAIFVDRGWTPSDNEQAEGRVFRADERTIGRPDPVIYTDLVADHPIDRRLADLLQHKREIIASTVGAAAVKPGRSAPARSTRPPVRLPEQNRRPGCRPARSPIEFWAEEALGRLATGGTLTKLEAPYFLSLARDIPTGLTGKQWASLSRSLRRFKTIGAPPAGAQGGLK